MMIMFVVMPIVIWLPLGVYLYRLVQRFLSLFETHISMIVRRVIAVILTVFCISRGWMLYGLGAVVILHFIVFSAIMEIVWRIGKKIITSQKKQKVFDIIYKSSIVSVCFVVLVMAYGAYNMLQVRETSYHLTTNKELPKDLLIAQVSDLHCGTTPLDDFQQNINKIEEENPDILALTGDIFDERTSRKDMERAINIISKVKTTYGIYYVWGNHDYNSYADTPSYTADELKTALEKAGIVVLDDKKVTVDKNITIVGREDATQQNRNETNELLKNTAKNSFVLLLDHQPRGLKENKKAGVDLQLSGHTHAGQIFPTGQLGAFTGATELNYGYLKDGNYQAIVSSGYAGWGYAIRTGGHSEYCMIHVKSSR